LRVTAEKKIFMIEPNITYILLFGTAVLSYIFERDKQIININDPKELEQYMRQNGCDERDIAEMRKSLRKLMKDNAKNKRKKERD